MGVAEPKLSDSGRFTPKLNHLIEHLSGTIEKRQEADGHWHYALDDSITMNAEYIFFLRWMKEDDSELIERLAFFILQQQLEDGSWNIFYGGAGNLDATVESYFALRLAGYEKSNPALEKARKYILSHGGLPKSRVFTKIWLALFELYPWEGVPIIPPEIMLAPRGTPFNIYEFSYWSRSVIIPLTILFDVKRTMKVNFDLDELYSSKESKSDLSYPVPLPVDEQYYEKKAMLPKDWISWEHVFIALNRGVGFYETRLPVKPLRKTALQMAEKWILSHQDDSGDWGGIMPAMMNSIMALSSLGYSRESEPMKKGLSALRRLCRGVSPVIRPHATEDARSATLQSCVSPIWDTSLACLGLLEAGSDPNSESLQKTKDFLWNNKITRKADWKYKAKIRPSQLTYAWCFQYHNEFFPDLDDTALSILVLKQLGMTKEDLEPALQWIFGMQNSDGGWGTFDRHNDQWILNEIPFADLKSLIDPSNPDITGHLLESLGDLGFQHTRSVRKAVAYLKRVQRDNGSWFGRWGVHTLYGTCAAVVGMRKVGESAESSSMQRALQFVLSRQNADGGWGESCESYAPNAEDGVGESTPSQTAWALMTLQACWGCSLQTELESAVSRALDFLSSRITDDGLKEPHFTGTGFPQHFYLRYDGYRNFFPLIALGRLRQVVQTQ